MNTILGWSGFCLMAAPLIIAAYNMHPLFGVFTVGYCLVFVCIFLQYPTDS